MNDYRNECRRYLLYLAAFVAAMVMLCACADADIINGGFEDGEGYALPGWTNAGCITQWYALELPEGRVAYVDPDNSYSTPTWMINETVFPPGTYHLSLWASRVRQAGDTCTLYAALGEDLLVFDVAPGWRQYSGTLYNLAPAQLQIGAWALADDSVAVDNVEVHAPEPAGLLVLIGGILIWTSRRKPR